jgi:RimJ/RimL family protein N-acetyltransferase
VKNFVARVGVYPETGASDHPFMTYSLVPLDDRHLPGIAAIVADPEALRFTRIPEPAPPGFEVTWLGRYRGTDERAGFAIEDERGTFLGMALVVEIDREGKQVELGYIVHPAARGRGVATAALRLLTRWAFEELGTLRATLHIDTENAPSLRVAERAGYVKEGVLRSVHVKQGLRADTEIWSRLPADPE